MDLQEIKVGMQVAVARLNETDGMLIAAKHLVVRQVGTVGTVTGYVPAMAEMSGGCTIPNIVCAGQIKI